MSKDPLHGKTLEMILIELVNQFGWEYLGDAISIRCFKFRTPDPTEEETLKTA